MAESRQPRWQNPFSGNFTFCLSPFADTRQQTKPYRNRYSKALHRIDRFVSFQYTNKSRKFHLSHQIPMKFKSDSRWNGFVHPKNRIAGDINNADDAGLSNTWNLFEVGGRRRGCWGCESNKPLLPKTTVKYPNSHIDAGRSNVERKRKSRPLHTSAMSFTMAQFTLHFETIEWDTMGRPRQCGYRNPIEKWNYTFIWWANKTILAFDSCNYSQNAKWLIDFLGSCHDVVCCQIDRPTVGINIFQSARYLGIIQYSASESLCCDLRGTKNGIWCR